MTIRIHTLSKEFIRIPVAAKEAGVVVNPTALPVSLAFKSSGPLAGGDFTAASWETDAVTEPDTYFARATVGGPTSGATFALAEGLYRCYVKITGSPEVPVIESVELVEIYS